MIYLLNLDWLKAILNITTIILAVTVGKPILSFPLGISLYLSFKPNTPDYTVLFHL
jgi:hypothetical protein